MHKTILVTGSAGFAGSHFVEHCLQNTDWYIIGLDSFKHRGDSMRVQADMDPARYTPMYCDLAAPISSRMTEKIGHVDFIVNYAAESHVDRSITDPVPFVTNNVAVALNMLEYARVAKPKVFIQISTDEVYGPAVGEHCHGEWDPIIPSNPYSASKAAQEAIAISYWRTYGVPLIMTQTMNLVGERQDPEKFTSGLISKISKGQTVTIHGTPERIGSRFYLHARNKAAALLHLLTHVEPTMYEDLDSHVVKPSRYNIVGEREIDNLELAKMVAKMLGKPLNYVFEDFHASRPGHDRRYALDGSKLAATGYKHPLTLEESMQRMIDWTLKHPEWIG